MMATAVLSHHVVPGALGPVLVDIRSASRAVPQPAVLIVHGFKGFKDYALLVAAAERLARAGFTAVTISVSGSGVDAAGEFAWPERFARNTYTREMNDIELVIDQLLSGAFDTVPPTSLGLIGHSRGGGVALCVAREVSGIDALVTWAAMSTIRRYSDAEVALWRTLGTIHVGNTRTGQALPMHYEIVEDALANEARFDITAAARSVTMPWLLIHGTDDETIPIEEGRDLARIAARPGFESLFIAGANHAFGAQHPWTGATPHTTQLFDATLHFLARHLR